RPTPMGWVLDGRAADDELAGAEDEPVELERDGARLLVRIDRGRFRPVPGADAEEAGAQVAAGTQLELFAAAGPAAPPLGPLLPPLPPPAEPPLHDVRVLSFTQLSTFERCSYRYYAERVVGMRAREQIGGVGGGEPGEGLGAIGLGSAVHAVLERIDLREPAVP